MNDQRFREWTKAECAACHAEYQVSTLLAAGLLNGSGAMPTMAMRQQAAESRVHADLLFHQLVLMPAGVPEAASISVSQRSLPEPAAR